MSFSTSPIVIDGKGHLLGRLASIVSKQVSRRILIPNEVMGRRSEVVRNSWSRKLPGLRHGRA